MVCRWPPYTSRQPVASHDDATPPAPSVTPCVAQCAGRLAGRRRAPAVGPVAAGVPRCRRLRDGRPAGGGRPAAAGSRMAVRRCLAVPGHGLDVVPHRTRLLGGGVDVRRVPCGGRMGGTARSVAGDRPPGSAHAGRGVAVLLPVRRCAAGQCGHRAGGGAVRGDRPRRRRHPAHLVRVPGGLRARRAFTGGAGTGASEASPPRASGMACWRSSPP